MCFFERAEGTLLYDCLKKQMRHRIEQKLPLRLPQHPVDLNSQPVNSSHDQEISEEPIHYNFFNLGNGKDATNANFGTSKWAPFNLQDMKNHPYNFCCPAVTNLTETLSFIKPQKRVLCQSSSSASLIAYCTRLLEKVVHVSTIIVFSHSLLQMNMLV